MWYMKPKLQGAAWWHHTHISDLTHECFRTEMRNVPKSDLQCRLCRLSKNTNTNRDCCLHPVRSPLQRRYWTLYSLFKGTAQIITHLHHEQAGEDERDRDRNRKMYDWRTFLLFIVIGACIAMYLHVLYCRHQKYRDVGKPFFKGLFFSSQNCLPGFDLPFDVSMPEG